MRPVITNANTRTANFFFMTFASYQIFNLLIFFSPLFSPGKPVVDIPWETIIRCLAPLVTEKIAEKSHLYN